MNIVCIFLMCSAFIFMCNENFVETFTFGAGRKPCQLQIRTVYSNSLNFMQKIVSTLRIRMMVEHHFEMAKISSLIFQFPCVCTMEFWASIRCYTRVAAIGFRGKLRIFQLGVMFRALKMMQTEITITNRKEESHFCTTSKLRKSEKTDRGYVSFFFELPYLKCMVCVLCVYACVRACVSVCVSFEYVCLVQL